MDHAVVHSLCQQHGAINKFVPQASRGQVLVGYVRPEDASKAQRALNMCTLTGTQLLAELVGGDMEAAQLLDGPATGPAGRQPMPRPPAPVLPTAGSSAFQALPNMGTAGLLRSPGAATTHLGGGGESTLWGVTSAATAAPWSVGGGAAGAGINSPWGLSTSDHSTYLPNDLLGGQ